MLPRWLASLLPRDRGGEQPLGPEHATDIDRSMMALAIESARHAAMLGEVPVGAVIYRPASGEIIAKAHNLRESTANPAGHAELIAIVDAAKAIDDWRLNDLALAVTLEPCAMCAGAIVNARLGRLVFGARDPKAGFCASLGHLTVDRRLNHRVRPIEGVLAAESSQLLRDFFRARRSHAGRSSDPTRP